jgi:hypothetical protein
MTQKPDLEHINSIINKRLIKVPMEAKISFPDVLKQELVPMVFVTNPKFLMVVFVNPVEKDRIDACFLKKIDPFLGLINTQSNNAAFKLDKSKYTIIKDSGVSNSFALSLGLDSTVILENFKQSVDTNDLGTISYTISLAYIISYGDEINHATIYEYFENLVAYSTNIWSPTHD